MARCLSQASFPEKDSCRAFPDPQRDGLARGRAPSRRDGRRNFQILDPLACPECGGQMKVIAFIEPSQSDVIEKILRHRGLSCPASPRAPPAEDAWVHDLDGCFSDSPTGSSDQPAEPTLLQF